MTLECLTLGIIRDRFQEFLQGCTNFQELQTRMGPSPALGILFSPILDQKAKLSEDQNNEIWAQGERGMLL